jgi:Flp pilus assembly protein TadD
MGGEIDAALSWCEQLAAKSPTSHNVLGCAAMVAMRAGEFGLAAGFIERARELNPGNAKWTWVEREIQTFKAKQIAAR